MIAAQWLSLLISAGMLALSVVALLRLRSSPLAPSLAAFGFACFTVRFSGFAWSLGSGTDWPYFVRPVYPLIPAVGMEFVLVFVGARGALARSKWLGYLFALRRAARRAAYARAAPVGRCRPDQPGRGR